MFHLFNLDQLELALHDPLGEILARVAWDVYSTYHTSLYDSLG